MTKSPPVFQTVSPDGANAFLFPYKGKLYAVHPRLPGKAGQPGAMKHEKLSRPVPLGKPILERCGFLIRQFSGNPGPDWIFEPVPVDASVLCDGMHLKVCLPDRQVDAYVNVSKINGNDRIAPGSPVGERAVQGILIQAPDADISLFGACPVIDGRTGHLVGVVAHAESDATESQFYLDPIHDLTRLAANAAEYQSASFFNLVNGKLGRGEAAKLAGILPPDIIDLQFGKSDAADFLHARPNVLVLDREEFLVSRFGNSSEISVSQPMKKTHQNIGLIWNKPKGGIRLDLKYSEYENTLQVVLALDARDQPRLESPFAGTKLPSRTSASSVLDEFFDHLEDLPQDPKSRLSRMDVFKALMKD